MLPSTDVSPTVGDRDVAQLLACMKPLSSTPTLPVSAVRRWRQEGQEFKVIIGYRK